MVILDLYFGSVLFCSYLVENSLFMIRSELNTSNYNAYYQIYLDQLATDLELLPGYLEGKTTMVDFMLNLPEDKENYAYGPGKWTVKEVIQHIIDTERLFMYRCLRVARADSTPLAGFEQDDYIASSNANNKSMDSLIREYKATRDYSMNLLQSFRKQDLIQVGTASGSPVSAAAAAFMVLGHELWHKKVLEERYL